MSQDLNKLIVMRFYDELWNDRRLDVADKIFARDCVSHQLQSGSEVGSISRDPAAIKHHLLAWLIGFPDLRFAVEEIIAEGDRVVSRAVMVGTHTGVWSDIAPTNKRVSIRMMVTHRIQNGRIVEDWVLVESLGLFQQLGLLPSIDEILRRTIKH